MANSEIFANPVPADASGRRAAGLAERYAQLRGRVQGALHSGEAAVGEQPVVDGFEAYGQRTVDAVNVLDAHGRDAADRVRASAAVVSATDADHTAGFDRAAGTLSIPFRRS
jgi:hypothetical protein